MDSAENVARLSTRLYPKLSPAEQKATIREFERLQGLEAARRSEEEVAKVYRENPDLEVQY